MFDEGWNCDQVPEWKEEKCCKWCHASGERSFAFRVKNEIKRVCCRYSVAFIQLFSTEDVVLLDCDLALTPRP